MAAARKRHPAQTIDVEAYIAEDLWICESLFTPWTAPRETPLGGVGATLSWRCGHKLKRGLRRILTYIFNPLDSRSLSPHGICLLWRPDYGVEALLEPGECILRKPYGFDELHAARAAALKAS